jgi:hypothetical protein
MAAGIAPADRTPLPASSPTEPDRRTLILAVALSVLFIAATRWPVARTAPLESDEFGFLERVATQWFPMHHTLFQAFARLVGLAIGDAYRGFVLVDMFTSAIALLSMWWLLRAIVRSATAAAAALLLGVSPIFWGYGAMAGNYTAIVAVGAFLLGVAYRGRVDPRAWHPFAAAVALAVGAGYRPDIGTLWIALFGVILWQHRWKRAAVAWLLFTLINLVWLTPMLRDNGGWTRYRELSADFAYQCGYLNSIWHLGFFDGPVRYLVKLVMALVWTLGPALFFIPRGVARLGRTADGRFLVFLSVLVAIPAVGSHLLVHFGVPGWSFHYVPALLTLCAVGVERSGVLNAAARTPGLFVGWLTREAAAARLLAMAGVLAVLFLFYPTDYNQAGWRGSFDLSFCRFTRIGLKSPIPERAPAYWRTANSRPLAGTPRTWPSAISPGAESHLID